MEEENAKFIAPDNDEMVKGIAVYDPTRVFMIKPSFLEADEPKPLKWYKKIYYFLWKVFHSIAYYTFMIVLLRCIQIACIGFLVWWFITYAR